MKRKVPAAICIILIMVSTLAGCGGGEKIDPSNPVTLNLWHNYGGQLKETMDNMIDEFNESIGIEKGIIINVTLFPAALLSMKNLLWQLIKTQVPLSARTSPRPIPKLLLF